MSFFLIPVICFPSLRKMLFPGTVLRNKKMNKHPRPA